jgi:hypothetical protein
MAVHGESLKWFLPIFKSHSLGASSDPYNWLKLRSYLPLLFAVLQTPWTKQKWWGDNFRWKLSSWNNWRNDCDSRLNGWKVHIQGIFLVWKFPVAPLEWNFQNLDVSVLFYLLSWIDQYTICESRLKRLKSYSRGYFYTKIPRLLN